MPKTKNFSGHMLFLAYVLANIVYWYIPSCVMGLIKLVQQVPDKKHAIKFLQDIRILYKNGLCGSGYQMHINLSEKKDRWVCKKRSCRESVGLRKGTFLENSCTEGSVSVTEPAPILCYSCNSEYDPRCGDPFDPFSIGIINCSLKERLEHLPKEKPKICRKNVQRVYGKTRVIRGCGYIEDIHKDQKCLYRSGTFNVNAAYCSCSGNLCNSGKQRAVPFLLLGLAATAALLLCRSSNCLL